MLSEKERIKLQIDKLIAEKDMLKARYILKQDKLSREIESLQVDLENIEIYEEISSGSYD